MSNKYLVLSITNGIATVKHICWFCKTKYKLKYPCDDIGMKSKSDRLCLVCEKGLKKFKKNNPEVC